MPIRGPQFEIRYRPMVDAYSRPLQQCADADDATLALHAALEQLRHSDPDSELFVFKHDAGWHLVLHYPLHRFRWHA